MNELEIPVGSYFKYCGLTYKAVKVSDNAIDPHNYLSKCELCALNRNGRKLCLSDSCECGYCSSWTRGDAKEIVFTLNEDLDPKTVDKIISVRKELAEVNDLRRDNAYLKRQKKILTDENRKLKEQNEDFKRQLKTVYANINKAIKTEIYKYFTKEYK